MGLTKQSTGTDVLNDFFRINTHPAGERVIALAGNPNTGKSTVFNSLTGMNQHTGNWPGKTVANAQGRFSYKNQKYLLVDLPGTYSLLSTSVEEEVARDFICFAQPDATVVVTDATSLERNLNLVLQVLEITDRVVVCVNLVDEARRKKIEINLNHLAKLLGVPVVGTNARDGEGLDDLKAAIARVSSGQQATRPRQVKFPEEIERAVGDLQPKLDYLTQGKVSSRWLALRLVEGEQTILNSLAKFHNIELGQDDQLSGVHEEFCTAHDIQAEDVRDMVVGSIVTEAEDIYNQTVSIESKNHNALDRKIDKVLTSKAFGIPIMLALLGLVFAITIWGANYPSELLASMFAIIEDWLGGLSLWSYLPEWVPGIIIQGIYRTLAWVISVMLPPMAIFFPLFTLLEDLGYLPRVAFNLDHYFKKACAHGKQALTMCMGFGCNAAGIIACRIIDSPRERLIAIITNNFVPCNGRFPILISLAMIFIGGAAGAFAGGVATLAVLAVVVGGILMTLLVSRVLSKTLLKGVPSSFTLEMPPYRKPKVGRIIVRSIFDRTLFVLGRAIIVAAPAGVVIWLAANTFLGGTSLLIHGANFLGPLGWAMGLDGIILMAFLLGLPANEIVIPIIIMSYMATGSMLELDSMNALRELLVNNGWTWLTAVNVMILTLLHFPCGTTLLTIKKETQSWKWTFVSFLVPTVLGILICILVATVARLLGLA